MAMGNVCSLVMGGVEHILDVLYEDREIRDQPCAKYKHLRPILASFVRFIYTFTNAPSSVPNI